MAIIDRKCECTHFSSQHHSPGGGWAGYGDECQVPLCKCADFVEEKCKTITQERTKAIVIIDRIIKNLTEARVRIEQTQIETYDSHVDDLTGYAQEDIDKLRDIVS